MEDPATVEEIQVIERRLISLPSSHVEQLQLLDLVENVLRRVAQSSPQPVIEALKPITKALVADVLLKNDVRDVKISVASCISQIMRITAPDSPYSDEESKIYFQVSVSAFGELSSLSYPEFTKAVSILESFAMFRICIVMLDLELDTEIVIMFRNLFCSAGSNLSPEVSIYMERIMTLVIEEREELSDEIIMLLLDNLKMENRKAQPLAWELGVEILKNCGTILKKYIPEAVELMGLDLSDFAEIVASICQDDSGKQNLEVKEAVPEAIDCEKASGSTTGTKNSTDPNGERDSSKPKKSSKKRKSIIQSKQQSSSEKIDTSKENEDELPIAAMKGSYSRSKRSAKGESSKKTNKQQRTESETIATTAELEVMEASPEATDCEKASGSNTATKNSTDPNVKPDDASKKRKSITQSKQPKSSKTTDTSLENEDEQPIAAMKGSNSRSKRSAKGESSGATNKRQRTESEIIATSAEEMKAGLDSTEVQPEKRKQRTESEIIGTNAEETKEGVDTTEAKPEKRIRKPNSLLKPEEGYWTLQMMRSSKMKLDPANFSEGHEKVTNTVLEKNRMKSKSRQHGEASKVKRKSISTELKEDEATRETPVIKVCGQKLVGRKIKVWWPEDRVFYPGKIASFDRASDKYEVLYHDGVMEMLDLEKEKWELLKDGEEVSGSAAPIDMVTPESEPAKADIVEVRGYMVTASTADTLQSIFSKYGDIASNCPYKSASIKASLLEIVCTTLQKLQDDDSPPDFNDVESVINDAEKAKLEIGWLRVELEKKRVAHKASQKAKMLRGAKRQVLHAAKAAKTQLKHRRAELVAAQKRFVEAERCFNALRCVHKKFKDDILELEESRKNGSRMV